MFVLHSDIAAGGEEQCGQHFDGGCFAGAVGAKQAEKFAGLDGERDVVNGDYFLGLAAYFTDIGFENAAQVLCFDGVRFGEILLVVDTCLTPARKHCNTESVNIL